MDSKKIIADIWNPILKKAGFLKKWSSWYLINPEVIGILNIQKSQWSDLCFINIGLFVIKDEPLDFFPRDTLCHFQFRLVEDNILGHDKMVIQNILNFENEPSESDKKFLIEIAEELIQIFFFKYRTKEDILQSIKNDSMNIIKKTNENRMIAFDGKERLGWVKS